MSETWKQQRARLEHLATGRGYNPITKNDRAAIAALLATLDQFKRFHTETDLAVEFARADERQRVLAEVAHEFQE